MAAKDGRSYKVVMLGESEVGKSALTLQYVTNVFLDFYDPTIEDVYQVQTVINNETAIFDILDTAGQSDLEKSMKDQYFRQGEAYICVYSITDINSFHRIKQQISTLQRVRSLEKIPIVVVGNKLDLCSERKISTLDGMALAREHDCLFYETSAATRVNLEEVFSSLVKQLRTFNNMDKFQKPSKNRTRRLKNFLIKKKNFYQAQLLFK